jgi:hypothetical protein
MPSACNSETCSERPSRLTDQAITCRSGAARLELEFARASVFQKFSKRSGLASVCRRGQRPDWSPAAPPASLARRSRHPQRRLPRLFADRDRQPTGYPVGQYPLSFPLNASSLQSIRGRQAAGPLRSELVNLHPQQHTSPLSA